MSGAVACCCILQSCTAACCNAACCAAPRSLRALLPLRRGRAASCPVREIPGISSISDPFALASDALFAAGRRGLRELLCTDTRPVVSLLLLRCPLMLMQGVAAALPTTPIGELKTHLARTARRGRATATRTPAKRGRREEERRWAEASFFSARSLAPVVCSAHRHLLATHVAPKGPFGRCYDISSALRVPGGPDARDLPLPHRCCCCCCCAHSGGRPPWSRAKPGRGGPLCLGC